MPFVHRVALFIATFQILAGRSLFRYSHAHMKKDLHPSDYRMVIFEDSSSGARFLIGSTVATEKKDKWLNPKEGLPGQPIRVGLGEDGKEYPVFQVEISSASHPFYTGQSKTIDTAGRVEKFKARAAKTKK